MPSMIETLIGGGLRRTDDKRIVPTRRPCPARPRDLFELFSAMSDAASLKTLFQSADFKGADPRALTFVTLSRWPTPEEHAALPVPYDVAAHLRGMLLGPEFRQTLFRRICDAYPERQRLLHVRIPASAGAHFLRTVGPLHPIFPPTLSTWNRNDAATFIAALGAYLGRFTATKTILASLPQQKFFTSAAAHNGDPQNPIPWTLNPPPYRAGDRLFTILREPTSLILSLVNAILSRLQDTPAEDDPETAAWRARLAPLPADWKQTGRRVLAMLPHRNPICTALADGTAANTLQTCRLTNIELADLSRYAPWIKYSWTTEPGPPLLASTPCLTRDDLTQAETRHLHDIVAEDLEFHAHFQKILALQGQYQPSVLGKDL